MMTQAEIQAFQEERRTVVGGTDLAAILGLAPKSWPNATPIGIYRVKKGLSDPPEQTFAMARGTAMEPMIIERFAARFGVEVETGLGLVRHPEKDHVGCHPDGMVRTDNGPEVVEAKSVGLLRAMADEWGDDGSDDIPVYYEFQTRLNMAVMDAERCHVPVGFADTEACFVIDRDLELERDFMERVDRFWFDHVVAGVEPDPINMADAKLLWPSAMEGKTVVASSDVLDRLSAFRNARKWRLHYKKQEDKHAEHLALALGDGEAFIGPDDPRPIFTRKSSTRKAYSVDATTFRTPRVTKFGADTLDDRHAVLSAQDRSK